MIVFHKLSSRRTLALYVPDKPTGWARAQGKDDGGKGYTSAEVVEIASGWNHHIYSLVSKWAREHGHLISYDEYQSLGKEKAPA
jgi:hypothetical protein